MSNPATLPARAIANLLAAASLSLTYGTNLYDTAELPPVSGVPHAAVFCCEYGGAPPVPYLGTHTDRRDFDVQVLLRGDPDDIDTVRTLAWGAWAALQRAASTGYIDVLCKQSGPIYLGKDDTNHAKFSINLTVRYSG